MGANLTGSRRRLQDGGAADAPAPACGPLRASFDEAIAPRADPVEVAWYEARLPRGAGVLLHPFAGHGRLLIPLSEAGFALHGVDPSAACLARCRARLDEAGRTAELFRQDVWSLNLPFRYAAAFLAPRTFQRLSDRRRALDALLRIRAHLVEPGLLLLPFDVPAQAAHPPGAAVVEWRMLRLADGSRIARRSETLIDVAARRSEVHSRFERRHDARVSAREDEVCEATWYTEEQAAELVADAGYRDIRRESLPSLPPEDGAPAQRFALVARL
ncbi:MAG TPA: class I SAM-dependent methyltransferase [Casimicrobiaceae bacterium]|nr:class I SAM-dependent methyltransferase [Casimicrobiaceae bacterium]